jgi:hypothetical protein
MTIFLTIAGGALIGAALHDIFQTLFHPSSHGALSDRVENGLWRAFRAAAERRETIINVAGPTIFVSVLGMWVLLNVLGFALIYFPRLATEFVLAPGLDPARHHTFYDAVNVSLGSLVNFGGDFNTESKTLRLLMGSEGIIGFGILTAGVSWLLSIYPVLEQRRSLAHQATLLHNAEIETGTGLFDLDEQETFDLLSGLAQEVIQLRNSLDQFPVTYYFRSAEDKSSLAGILGYLHGVAQHASEHSAASLRFAGAVLGGAIEDYLELVGSDHLRIDDDDPAIILETYAHDHMRRVVKYAA